LSQCKIKMDKEMEAPKFNAVMAGLVLAIHVFVAASRGCPGQARA
jgi:hypothetical protein